MQFLSAASAWFFTSLLVIALMYILRKTYRDTEVASHLLWRRLLQEQEANRPWQRLRSRWLLLLQLLAASLLVLALMEPVILRPSSPSERAVIIIDRSASMTAVAEIEAASQLTTKFELAVDEAKNWIDRQPDNRLITVIATGAVPVEIVSSERNRQVLRDALDELTPYFGLTDHVAALSLADSLHQGKDGGATVVFTDGQWRDAEEANGLQLYHPLQIVTVGSNLPNWNGSILHFGIRPDINEPGSYHAAVTIRNDGELEREFTIEIYSGYADRPLERAAVRSIDIAPGEWGSIELSGLPPAAYYKAQLLPAIDRIPMDNVAYGFPVVQGGSHALVVSTEGNLFLEKALLLSGVIPVKINVDSTPPSGELAEGIDWIVIDGAYERLKDDERWSKLLADKPLWLIDHPDEKDKRSAVPNNAIVQTQEHPLLSFITFSDTHIGRMNRLSPEDGDWGDTVLTYGDVPAILAGQMEGKPRLRYTFKLQDTDLPLRPEFPVLVFQSSQWMNGGMQGDLGSVSAGEMLSLSLHAEIDRAEWEGVEWSDVRKERKGQLLPVDIGSMIEAPGIPGLYRLLEWSEQGDLLASRYLSVSAHPDELQPAPELQLSSLSLGEVQKGESGIDHDSPLVPQSLLPWAIVLILMLLLTEWEVYRRGHSS
ncbi:vWA domain-containing protein [Paenibacillus paeoniae]|uniref:VWA domain-containing protein n=1 Tax=Paenibacillus paeoniae TaxID=2292705 RepID=A0A371PLG7_9BACL|nr:VWA domain-containing protein [Paenibacillus paeoniae]REK76607.1 VWA domain-containing protein [Paenibacillus paeoniae]